MSPSPPPPGAVGTWGTLGEEEVRAEAAKVGWGTVGEEDDDEGAKAVVAVSITGCEGWGRAAAAASQGGMWGNVQTKEKEVLVLFSNR